MNIWNDPGNGITHSLVLRERQAGQWPRDEHAAYCCQCCRQINNMGGTQCSHITKPGALWAGMASPEQSRQPSQPGKASPGAPDDEAWPVWRRLAGLRRLAGVEQLEASLASLDHVLHLAKHDQHGHHSAPLRRKSSLAIMWALLVRSEACSVLVSIATSVPF
jgi:hypothetical protein